MALIYFRNDGETADTPISDGHPLPVRLIGEPGLWVSDWVAVPYGATAGALDANDALGDPFTFASSISGEPLPRLGIIRSIEMIDRADVTLAATIHIYGAAFPAAASDAAYTVAVVDSTKIIAAEAFDSGTDEGAFKYHVIKGVNKDYVAELRQFVCQLSSTGTPTVAAGTTPLVRISILPQE